MAGFFRKEISAEVEIEAPIKRVWQIVTDLGRYSGWNPYIRRAAGELKPGARLDVRVTPVGEPAITFQPTVLVVESRKELRWRARFLMPGLFDGEYSIQLESTGPKHVRVTQREILSGCLVPLYPPDGMRKGFEAMNSKLKELAEESFSA